MSYNIDWSNKEDVLKAVSKTGSELQKASKKLKDDKDVVLAAVHNAGYALRYASGRLKNDKEVILTAVDNSNSAFVYTGHTLQNDKEFILEILKSSSFTGYFLRYVNAELRNNKEFMLDAIKIYPYNVYYASDELKNNKAFMLDVVKIDGNMLCNASEKFKNDKEVVVEAVKNDERAIHFVGYSINIDDILDEIHQFSHEKFNEELSNEAFGKDLDSMKQNYNEEIISSIDSQEGSFDLSDDLKFDIEKIEGMITSLTSLKKLLEKKEIYRLKFVN